jgi:hypothetical protein
MPKTISTDLRRRLELGADQFIDDCRAKGIPFKPSKEPRHVQEAELRAAFIHIGETMPEEKLKSVLPWLISKPTPGTLRSSTL